MNTHVLGLLYSLRLGRVLVVGIRFSMCRSLELRLQDGHTSFAALDWEPALSSSEEQLVEVAVKVEEAQAEGGTLSSASGILQGNGHLSWNVRVA